MTMIASKSKGLTRFELIVILLIFCGVAAVLYPVFVRAREAARHASCQSNMRELGTVLHMYWADYDNMLPSSALHMPEGAGNWDPLASAEFCAELGAVPPPKRLAPAGVHWIQLGWRYLVNKDSIWCPTDEANAWWHHPDARTFVSYIYKPAVDRAWFGGLYPLDPKKPGENLVMKCFRKDSDFPRPDAQMILFEKKSWHWGEAQRGWRENVRLNAAFMDGRVESITLRQAADFDACENAADLAAAMRRPGEPFWFNCRRENDKEITGRGVWYDPRIYYDRVPLYP